MEPTLEEKLTELLDLYAAGLMEQRELLLLLLALPQVVGGLAWALRADRLAEGPADPRGVWAWLRRDGPIAVLLGSGIAGLLVALGKPSVFDDAYISFRYARHLADGHGLVWNVGERVEGYTNFLWTLLLGLLDWATPLDPLH